MFLHWPTIRRIGFGRWVYRQAIRQFHTRLRGRSHWMRLPGGGRLELPPRSPSASAVWLFGADVDFGFEALCARWVDPEGLVVDVGANIGYYSVYLGTRAKATYAFEPDPRNFAVLRRNLAQLPEARHLPVALADAPGIMDFEPSGNTSEGHLLSPGQARSGAAISVSVDTLDRALQHEPRRVAILKIDAEGSDLKVLRGAAERIARDRPVIVLESNPDRYVFDLAQRFEYGVYGAYPGASAAAPALWPVPRPYTQTGLIMLVPLRLIERDRIVVRPSPESLLQFHPDPGV